MSDKHAEAPQMARKVNPLRWKRAQFGRHESTCGRWAIYCSSRDRKRPQWTVFEIGVGTRDTGFSMADAKRVASEWAAGVRKCSLDTANAPSVSEGPKSDNAGSVSGKAEK